MTSEVFCNYCGAANVVTVNFCSFCGKTLAAVGQPQALVLIKQRYRVLRQIGVGAFGEVFLVEDAGQSNRSLAMKRLNLATAQVSDHQKMIDKFQREAQILGSIRHSQVPAIHEFFVDSGHYYIAMDFIEGETLADRLQTLGTTPFAPLEAAKIGIELANVLDYLHTRTPPIVFRDLNPNNIMLTPHGKTMLIDFGIARYLKPGEKRHTESLGTVGYVSPEHRNLATQLSDIYSLGAILHEMLSGEEPPKHPASSYPQLQLQGPVQKKLAELVMRMLSYDTKGRPASAAEVKNALQLIQQELAQQASPAGPPTQVLARTAPPTRLLQHSLQSRSNTPGEISYIYQANQTVRALTWSPDGLHLAVGGEEPDVVHVWQALTGKTIQTYKSHQRPILALAWSPDNRYLASASSDRTVRVWEALLGLERQVYREHGHWIQTLSWSPAGTLVASGDAQGLIHLWDARTGQQNMVYRGHTASILALAFSPDGRLLASTEDSDQYTIRVWEVQSGRLQTVYAGHKDTVSALAWSPDGKQIVSGCWDRTDHALHVWDARTGQRTALYSHHTRLVNAISWSQTNNLVASASKDKTIHLWHPQTGQTQFIYRGHNTGVNLLSWSPSGAYLASAGDDSHVQVWCAN